MILGNLAIARTSNSTSKHTKKPRQSNSQTVSFKRRLSKLRLLYTRTEKLRIAGQPICLLYFYLITILERRGRQPFFLA